MERLTKQRLNDCSKHETGLRCAYVTDHQNIRYATIRFYVSSRDGDPALLVLAAPFDLPEKRHGSGRVATFWRYIHVPAGTKDFVAQAVAGLQELGVTGSRWEGF
jgi:hypothetical protein